MCLVWWRRISDLILWEWDLGRGDVLGLFAGILFVGLSLARAVLTSRLVFLTLPWVVSLVVRLSDQVCIWEGVVGVIWVTISL
jgi:hypothetical protein